MSLDTNTLRLLLLLGVTAIASGTMIARGYYALFRMHKGGRTVQPEENKSLDAAIH